MAPKPDADFNLANGHGYMLDSHFRAASRLNLQHYLWREALGYIVHPSISLSKASDAQLAIADIAFGTGMWLIDVAKKYPHAKLDGLDINLTQCPPSAWMPKNINLQHWSLFDDVPEEMVGKYDFVHVRLVIMVLTNEDRTRAMTNFYRLLKPGGYLQWDDMDSVRTRVKKIDPKMETPALDQLRLACWAEGRHDWMLELPSLLGEIGFVDAKMELNDDEEDLIRPFGDQHLCTMEEFGDRLVSVGEKDGANRFYRFVHESAAEGQRGAALCIPRFVVVARKPPVSDVKL